LDVGRGDRKRRLWRIVDVAKKVRENPHEFPESVCGGRALKALVPDQTSAPLATGTE
jgi:hypothetical protein